MFPSWMPWMWRPGEFGLVRRKSQGVSLENLRSQGKFKDKATSTPWFGYGIRS